MPSYINMVTTVTSGIINIIVNLLLIPLIGIQGAVIGTLVSYVYLAYVRMFDCLRYVKIKVGLKILLLNSILTIVHGALVAYDYKIAYVISLMAIVLFVLINYRSLRQLIRLVLKK